MSSVSVGPKISMEKKIPGPKKDIQQGVLGYPFSWVFLEVSVDLSTEQ